MRILNFILPWAYGIGIILGIYIYMAAAKLLMLVGVSEKISLVLGGWITLFSVLGVSFAIVKRKVRLPTTPPRKSVVGQFMLAVGNIAAVVTTVVPLSIGYISGHPELGLYTWFSLPVFMVNLVLWPLGWKFATSNDTKNT
jgi:hypothetical protein